ncbi:DUF6531 domain-containing protein [Paraburkholderia bonniea]|uniref:DUF6531 domain-containing protein n=1 Tax=Paraburkholderia bonniea TaxID=2152891 RepID=UPI002572CA96|nr:DUF6531 domain-containing protein [Paraburkholderia bonniea]WJF92128.1 DUF6531 domain-containing protein [Paraburkholderia bonniea]WJF95448.1 DUF6531 domain-containing protein [Paraburkholderia bonniea]
MTALEAARFGDPIAHTSNLAMLGKSLALIGEGLVVAAVVAGAVAAAPVILGGGGLAAAASVAGSAAAGCITGTAVLGVGGSIVAAIGTALVLNSNPVTDLNNWIDSKMDEWFPPEVSGSIIQGSANVKINDHLAARAAANLLEKAPDSPAVSLARRALFGGLGAAIGGMLLGPLGALAGAAIGAAMATPDPSLPGKPVDDDKALCSRHPPPQWLAEGSSNVLVNGQPAHRKGDKTTCEAKTSGGSNNVKMGGETLQVREISSEAPWWIKNLDLIAAAIALCRGGGWSKPLAKLACIGSQLAIMKATGMAQDYVMNLVTGHPVHAPTGAKILQGEEDLDFVLPSRLPLVWQRSYSSLDQREGLFGRGFSVPLEVGLKLHQPGEYPHSFTDEQGRDIPFPNVLPGESHWNAAEGYRLARLNNNHYAVQRDDGHCYDFGPARAHGAQQLCLQRMEDYNGNWIALHRDQDDRLVELADCAQRLYRLDYHPQHSARVSAVVLVQADASLSEASVLPRTLASYDYDHHGRLTGVHNALGEETRRFSWHDDGPGAGLMASHTLPEGLSSYYRWEAFADHPRVVEQWSDSGERWHSHYTLPSAGQPGQTEVTDHLKRRQRWQWNSRYAPLLHEDALGGRTTLEWDEDAQAQLLSATLAHGGRWHFSYNEQGQLIRQRDPLGQERQQQWRADMPWLASETEHNHTWRYSYDPAGNLYRITGPDGTETLLGYDHHGQEISRTDAHGRTRHLTWNIAGQLIAYTDCALRLTIARSRTHHDPDHTRA